MDPISYIFGIIKYVKNRVRNEYNDNYINNNNYYNNNINIDNSSIKAVGECARAMLCNEFCDTLTLVLPCHRILNELINILEITDVLVSRNITNSYTTLLITYRNLPYTIHIANSVHELPNIHLHFGLTCNNLAVNFDGTMSTIITHERINRHSSTSWLMSCIHDSQHKRFRTVLLDYTNSPDKLQAYTQQVHDMVARGFVYDKENSKNLTSYHYVELKSHFCIKEYSKRDISQCCNICQEQYDAEPSKKTVLLRCLHDYHVDCLQKWVQQSLNNPCPICRASVNYEPTSGFGDNQADEIIANYQGVGVQ
jgi:hypothetical protein